MNIMTVDYSMTLEQMIAAGSYDWKNSNITAKRFPLSDNDKVAFEPKLFHFHLHTSSKDAIKEMDKGGFRPAKIEELLTYGAILTDEQRKYPIVALGSVAKLDGSRGFACLVGDDVRRGLQLSWLGNGWFSDHCRFLGVRK